MAIIKKKHKGLTLTELIASMVIVAIVGLAVTIQFVAENKMRSAMQPRIMLARKANIAMDHMTRLLRFAYPDTVDLTVPNEISATINKEALPQFTGILGEENINVHYTLNVGTGVLTFDLDNDVDTLNNPVGPYEIARYITAFGSDFQDSPNLRITLVAQDGDNSIPLQTTIMTMGDKQ